MQTRHIKVVRDLTGDTRKSLMLVLAIAIGVFGIGSTLGAFSVLNREMARNYRGIQPASATIKLERGVEDPLLIGEIEKMPGIVAAERHASVLGRMRIGNDWYPILLFVIDDFTNMKTNKVTHVSGTWPPPTGSMAVEQTALVVMKSVEGSPIPVKIPGAEPMAITISGLVHDPGLAPAWQEETGYAYVSMTTLRRLGGEDGFDEIKIIVSDVSSAQMVEQKAREVADWLEERGYRVHEVQVPPPLRHPHQGQMNAILTLFVAFGFLTLVLGAILVAASISTLMVRQVREIGIMKTLGAGSGDIAGLYLMMVLACSLVAALLGVALSQFSAGILIRTIARNLNLTIFDPSIPFWVVALQLLSGTMIPVFAAGIPVMRGSRTTIREALDNYGVTSARFGQGHWESIVSRLGRVGRTIALPIRNVFRQRSRLVLTMSLLAAGGGMFMTALNVSNAWDASLAKIYECRTYDVEFRLNRAVKGEEIVAKLGGLEGIGGIEAWAYSPTSIAGDTRYDITHTYPDKGHGSFVLVGVPLPTRLVNFPQVGGRWLTSETSRDVVLNHMARALVPTIAVGDSISLSVDGRPIRWRVCGFVEDIGSPSVAYVSFAAFGEAIGGPGLSNMLRIGMSNRDIDNVKQRSRAIEGILHQEQVSIGSVIPIGLLRNAIAEHMAVLVGALLAVAVLMGVVGGLGLLSTMSMSIMERTRELGVMRALGATPARIRMLLVHEGVAVGLMSLFFAVVIGVLLSMFLGNLLGSMAFKIPLPLTLNITPFLEWTVIVLAGSSIATLSPAWRAASMALRDALSA